MRQIDEIYASIAVLLVVSRTTLDPLRVNRKRCQRLMRTMYPGGLSETQDHGFRQPLHVLIPLFIASDLAITRPNQVWAADITICSYGRGFVYLVAIMDWYTRKVLSWRVSTSMDAAFCVRCRKSAAGDAQRFSILTREFNSRVKPSPMCYRQPVSNQYGWSWALAHVFIERLWRSLKYEEVNLSRL